ncbi:hypothetical protein [Bremerella cremea]|uniref:hypothetical protein n=1 Tax=Bremerella cremea TaxID=1031537 RepID=UPI0031E693DD
MPKQPDDPQLIATLESHGVNVRLRKSGQVHTLDFSKSSFPLDDQALLQLDSLQSLEVLNCENTAISDASVTTLLKHQNLKLMTLTDTGVSVEGIKRLRQNMIGCRIIA